MAGVREGVDAPTEAAGEVDESVGASDFDGFYRANYTWAVRVGRLLTGDVWTAEDVAQDAFSATHSRFVALDNPRAFLRTCIVNGCRSVHRRSARERRVRRPADSDAVGLDALELLDALDGLPYRQKAVLVLRYYADLPEAEIAAALRCRPGTVKSLAARGLARLRKVIEP